MEDGNATPDLQTILATLASFAPAAHPTGAAVSPYNVPAAHAPSTQVEQAASTPPLQHKESRVDDPHLRPQSRSTASPKPMIDPATITTWTEGLRCVTKIAAQNAQFAAKIKRVCSSPDSQRFRERIDTDRR